VLRELVSYASYLTGELSLTILNVSLIHESMMGISLVLSNVTGLYVPSWLRKSFLCSSYS
jgi:hypothetical protein